MSGLKRKILEYLRDGAAPDRWGRLLTPREQEVIRLTAAGQSGTMIAKELGISRATISRAKHSAAKKLEAISISQPEALHMSEPSSVDSLSVWDSPRVKAILERPEGTEIDLSGLTQDERDALVREAKGMWADHPEITDSVEWVRGLREGLSRSFPDPWRRAVRYQRLHRLPESLSRCGDLF